MGDGFDTYLKGDVKLVHWFDECKCKLVYASNKVVNSIYGEIGVLKLLPTKKLYFIVGEYVMKSSTIVKIETNGKAYRVLTKSGSVYIFRLL